MKIFAVDIGNTNTSMAIVEDREVYEKVVLPNDQIDRFTSKAQPLFRSLQDRSTRLVAVCSVVPELTEEIVLSAESALHADVMLIGEEIPLPIKLDLRDKRTVGPDRVVAAAMAYERMGQAVVVADFGSAITIDCVNDDGVFLGGAILPGLKLSVSALACRAAALPEVKLSLPKTPWGRNTAEAISAGVVLGAVGSLRQIVERYAQKLGQWPEIIVTGGDGEFIGQHCEFIHAVIPDLVLMGIELACDCYQATASE